MLTHPLLPKLRALRLSGMLQTLETRATQVVQGNLAPIAFLAILLDDELECRAGRRMRLHLAEARVDPAKTLAQFDFAAAPQINRTLILELAAGGFVTRGENVLLCDPTGTGKSHLANALAYGVLKRGQAVLLRSAQRLLTDLHAARADRTFGRWFARICAADLLVIDDFGLRPLSAQGAEDLYEIIAERYPYCGSPFS